MTGHAWQVSAKSACVQSDPVSPMANKAREPNCNEYLLTSTMSGTIIDAESVIGRDSLLCDMCANICVCVPVRD